MIVADLITTKADVIAFLYCYSDGMLLQYVIVAITTDKFMVLACYCQS